MQISKEDWKLFQKLLPSWQENYIKKLNQEYIQLLSRNENPSTNFWDLYKKINNNKKSPGVNLEMNKADTSLNLAKLLTRKIISKEDLSKFSPELQNEVNQIIDL